MNDRLSGLLGIARKAGILFSGQDTVRAELRRGKRLLVILSGDHSRNVRSMIEGYRIRGICRVMVIGCLGREELGRLLSTGPTQIVGMPLENGLSEKIEKLLTEEVDRYEQDQGL
ncbi:MAG TPA: hypothetical protein DDW96_03810 [Synergistaceae bacterium]|nr:MAG: Uncharacterized protein XD83_0370 [Synergistales bacterium 57_84]KUK88808.1 MAG: Uncharacterized protein XE01_0259 [Synergistales bacterium 58_81]HBG14434.1 hypothetical protein [Synergistaceae bacterium]HCP07914.1 hypothetical protein [Synergistaceae bacterium]